MPVPNSAVIVRTVSMYEADWQIVDDLAAQLFDGNASQAMRHIVRQFAQEQERLRANIDTFDTNAAEAT